MITYVFKYELRTGHYILGISGRVDNYTTSISKELRRGEYFKKFQQHYVPGYDPKITILEKHSLRASAEKSKIRMLWEYRDDPLLCNDQLVSNPRQTEKKSPKERAPHVHTPSEPYCRVGNVIYISGEEAGRAYGITSPTVRHRLRSNRYPEWVQLRKYNRGVQLKPGVFKLSTASGHYQYYVVRRQRSEDSLSESLLRLRAYLQPGESYTYELIQNCDVKTAERMVCQLTAENANDEFLVRSNLRLRLSVDGIEYDGIKHAAAAIRLKEGIIKRRIRSNDPTWADWFYIFE